MEEKHMETGKNREDLRALMKKEADRKSHTMAMKLRQTEHMMKRCIEKSVMGTGVYRSQHQLLMKLFFEKECSQAQLAEHMDISPAAVAVTLKKLEKGGYVKKRNQEGDNRRNQIEITEKGMQVVHTSITIFHEIDRALYEGFREEELDILGGFLDRMYANLVKYEGNSK